MKRRGALLLGGLTIAACGHDFEPPDRHARVLEAEAQYSAAAFDTLRWESDSARAFEGNEVYAAKCRRCHGPLGRGETEYARERGLTIPSLVEADWPYASDLDSLRHKIFIGHEEGMPIYGVAGISLREIDSSAFYVLNELRPDVISGGF